MTGLRPAKTARRRRDRARPGRVGIGRPGTSGRTGRRQQHLRPHRAAAEPENDAVDLAAALRRLGFEVTTELDADRGELTEALRAFTRQSAGADVSLVFYAGHGLEMDGINYLVPVDARLERDVDVRYETVTLGGRDGEEQPVHVGAARAPGRAAGDPDAVPPRPMVPRGGRAGARVRPSQPRVDVRARPRSEPGPSGSSPVVSLGRRRGTRRRPPKARRPSVTRGWPSGAGPPAP